jgi:hypothetical protein
MIFYLHFIYFVNSFLGYSMTRDKNIMLDFDLASQPLIKFLSHDVQNINIAQA